MEDPRHKQQQEGILVAPRPKVTYFCASPSPSSLFLAVQTGSLDCIRTLLRRGELIEQVNDVGLTPLLAATRAGNTAVISALLEAGADINSYGHTMWTALHFAAHRGDSATMEVLVMGGGDVSARTALKGKSPLHIAAGHAETQAVQELLLRWGADEKQLDGGGRSASDVAGALKNVFDRGHRHAEQVERIKAMLASAPRDRRWIRRRAVVMLVSRLRREIGRERYGGSAKKRGGWPDGSTEAAEQTAATAKAAVAATTEAVQEALGDVRLEVSVGGSVGASPLPSGLEAFRDAVIRLGSEDDVGIFRTVVGFL